LRSKDLYTVPRISVSLATKVSSQSPKRSLRLPCNRGDHESPAESIQESTAGVLSYKQQRLLD
jgi:hypothetical protein